MSEAQTVGEAVRNASAALSSESRQSDKSERSSDRDSKSERIESKTERTEPAASDDDEDFGAPGWVKQWKKPSREALKKLARMDGAADLMPNIYGEIESRYDYTGRTQADLERYRKRFDPYEQILTPLEQRYALQGIPPQAGLQQMIAVESYLQRDPDNALAWLAQQFKPNDAAKLVQQLAKHYNVNLQELTAEAPWVDPTIKAELDNLRAQLAPLQQAQQYGFQMLQQQYQQRLQHAQQQVAHSLQAFIEAKDESGNAQYPYAANLEPIMVQLVRTWDVNKEGHQPELPELYERAMKSLGGAFEERAKAAEQAAIEQAERQNASTEKAIAASRNVNGSKPAAKENRPASLRDAIEKASKRLTR